MRLMPVARIAALGLVMGGVSAARAAETAPEPGRRGLDLVGSCHAHGDGIADDSLPLKVCLTRLQAELDSGRETVLRIPAGIYRITGANGTMPTLKGRGGALVGEGPHQTYFVLDPSYDGDLFSWSEAWIQDNFGPTSFKAAQDPSGPTAIGIQVTGTTDSPHTQNAFVFYDRNDDVLMRDIEVNYLNGQCLSIGRTRAMPQAYMRESAFYNLKCWNAGTNALAAVEIGSTTTEGSDATNELDFYKLAVFAARGTGVAVRNPNPFSATRRLRFFGLRVEDVGRDGLVFGDPADRGQIAEIEVYGLTALTAKGAALRFTGADAAPPPYQISIRGGSLGPGDKTGIAIDKGRLLDIDLANVDAPVILGPGAGSQIAIRGDGAERDWRFEGTAPAGRTVLPLGLRTGFDLYGLPNGGDLVGAASLFGAGAGSIRLTMDGQPPDAYNCFNPGFAQVFNIRIQLVARAVDIPGRWFAWTMPLGVLADWTGPASTSWVAGQPEILAGPGAAGATVTSAADRQRGCLALEFTPPPGQGERWEATAQITFTRTR